MAHLRAVYSLKRELANDPHGLTEIHKLSLNKEKPFIGLGASYGLYGSPEWWRNVETGTIRRKVYRGVITRLFVSGLDEGPDPNAFEMQGNDGSLFRWNMLAEDKNDLHLYDIGRWVEVETVFTELKCPKPDGSPDYIEEPLRVSLSAD